MGENTGPSNNSKLKSKHTMYGKKRSANKKTFLVCAWNLFLLLPQKKYYFAASLYQCV